MCTILYRFKRFKKDSCLNKSKKRINTAYEASRIFMNVSEYSTWLNGHHLFAPVQCMNDEMEKFSPLVAKLRELLDKPTGQTEKIQLHHYDQLKKSIDPTHAVQGR